MWIDHKSENTLSGCLWSVRIAPGNPNQAFSICCTHKCTYILYIFYILHTTTTRCGSFLLFDVWGHWGIRGSLRQVYTASKWQSQNFNPQLYVPTTFPSSLPFKVLFSFAGYKILFLGEHTEITRPPLCLYGTNSRAALYRPWPRRWEAGESYSSSVSSENVWSQKKWRLYLTHCSILYPVLL